MSQQLHRVIVTLFAGSAAASKSFIVVRRCVHRLDRRGQTACDALAEGMAASSPKTFVREYLNEAQACSALRHTQAALGIKWLVKRTVHGLLSLAANEIFGVFGRDARAAGCTFSSRHAQRPITCHDR